MIDCRIRNVKNPDIKVVPIITRILIKRISLIILIGSVLGTIFYFGISGSLSRSYYDYEDEDDRKKVVTTS